MASWRLGRPGHLWCWLMSSLCVALGVWCFLCLSFWLSCSVGGLVEVGEEVSWFSGVMTSLFLCFLALAAARARWWLMSSNVREGEEVR